MNITIRQFTPDDYETVVAIANAVFPGYNDTVEEWRHSDAHRDPKCKHGRWVAEDGADPVGFGGYWQDPWIYHPTRFILSLNVLPEHQGLGIGRALYDTVLAALREHGVTRLLAFGREDYPRTLRFLADRGFVERMREWESILDLSAFDPAQYNGDESVLERDGLRVASYRDLEGDPDRDRKYAELDWTVGEDMPSAEKHTWVDPDHFKRTVIESPGFQPDATLFALDGDRYVGISMLSASPGDTTLMNGTTGVLREYRKRGIATALKLRNARWAKENGYQRIRTWNEQGNRAMLGINERMGFVKQPAWLNHAKDIAEEEST